jgi:phage replication-related protein YjqB (UPF0714/DUF867 family)
MSDTYKSYADLILRYQKDVHFRICYKNRGGKIIILAPHGGGIERGTSELAKAIANSDLSLYLFEGRLPKARQSQKLHITSTRFDEPIGCESIKGFSTSLAIHGCIGRAPLIYVGGRDEDMKYRLLEMLEKRGYPAKPGKGAYSGVFKTNICNRTYTGKGVQLELSNGFRRLLFQYWQTRKGRQIKTAQFDTFVNDIREVLI